MGQIKMGRNGVELFSSDADAVEQLYVDTDGTGSTHRL